MGDRRVLVPGCLLLSAWYILRPRVFCSAARTSVLSVMFCLCVCTLDCSLLSGVGALTSSGATGTVWRGLEVCVCSVSQLTFSAANRWKGCT